MYRGDNALICLGELSNSRFKQYLSDMKSSACVEPSGRSARLPEVGLQFTEQADYTMKRG